MEGKLRIEILVLTWLALFTFFGSTYGYSGIPESQVIQQGNTSSMLTRIKRAPTAGLVDIAQFADSSAAGKLHMVYVDDTMTRLIFQVTVYHTKPVIMAATPLKIPAAQRPTLTGDPTLNDGKVVATLDIPITKTDYGFWKFTKLDSSKWYVKIQGESPVSIKHQLFELGTNTPISGHPIIGSSYKLVITVIGFSNIKSGDMAFILSREKVSPITMATLTDTGNGNYEAASVKMPNETFMVCLQGKDNSNHMFKRLDVTEIVPATLDLIVPPYTGATIKEYTTFNITFVVTNLLHTSQEIDVRIEDSRGYAQAPKFLSSTLKFGGNFTGTFVLKAGFAGLTTSVKIVARQYFGKGSFSSGPEVQRNFTVISNQTTPLITTTVASTKMSSPKSVPATGTTQKVAAGPTTISASPSVSKSDSSKPTALGTSGLVSTLSPGMTGTATANKQSSVSVTATTVRINSGSPIAKRSTQTSPQTSASSPASIGNKPTDDPNESAVSNTDDTSTIGVPAAVALVVAGILTGVLIGVGIVGTAVVVHKKCKAKKVDVDQDTDRDMSQKRPSGTKLTLPAWR